MVLIPINYFPERETPPTSSNLYIGRIALEPGKNHVDSEAWELVKDHQMIKERLDQHVIEPLGGIIQLSPQEVDKIASTIVPKPPTVPPPPVPDKTTSSRTTSKEDKSDATSTSKS